MQKSTLLNAVLHYEDCCFSVLRAFIVVNMGKVISLRYCICSKPLQLVASHVVTGSSRKAAESNQSPARHVLSLLSVIFCAP